MPSLSLHKGLQRRDSLRTGWHRDGFGPLQSSVLHRTTVFATASALRAGCRLHALVGVEQRASVDGLHDGDNHTHTKLQLRGARLPLSSNTGAARHPIRNDRANIFCVDAAGYRGVRELHPDEVRSERMSGGRSVTLTTGDRDKLSPCRRLQLRQIRVHRWNPGLYVWPPGNAQCGMVMPRTWRERKLRGFLSR